MQSTSVGKDISQSVSLTKYFISLPRSRYQFIIMLVLALVFAIFLMYTQKITNPIQAVLTSTILLTVPAVFSALAFRVFRGVMLKRSMFLMLIASLFYALIYSIYFITTDLNLLVVGYSAIFIIVFLSSYFVFGLRYTALILTLIQLFFFSIMLYYLEYVTSSPRDLVLKLLVTCAIFSALAYIIMNIINAPLKKAFSISSTRAFSMFISQWLYESKDLEKEFNRIGVYADTFVDALFVKNGQGVCLITVPQVHFGPFGNLGGSNFPAQIASSLEDSADCCVVMHGACTHDYNPTTSAQLRNITGPLATFVREADVKCRNEKFAFVRTNYNHANASHLILGKSVLSSFSRHPYTTEDMDYGLGLLLREIGTKDFTTCMIADEHNSETGEITQFLLGTDEASEYISAMRMLGASLKTAKRENAKFSFTKFNRPGYERHGIGRGGISMFAFISPSNSVVYAVFDSNGITNSAKDRMERALNKVFGHAVIMTTDTHMLNKVNGVVNPVGVYDISELEEDVMDGARALIQTATPFKSYSRTIPIRVKVFGPRQSLKLIGTVNAIVAVTKLVLPLLLIFGTLFALWVLSFIS